MTVKLMRCVVIFVILAGSAQAQKVVRLYPGDPPGSEKIDNKEKQSFSSIWNTEVVTNVSRPSLAVYAPDAAVANGTAVVICPGGAFFALSINSEGIDVAKWLAAKGVTAFVLRYRLVPSGEDGVKEVMTRITDRKKMEEATAAVIPLSVADGRAAVSYVRSHAAEYGISPARIGLMGFSAGGTVTASVAFNYTAESRPDFVAPIYAYMGAVKETSVPTDAPPMFIAAASDDQLGLAPDSVSLFSKWLGAKKPVELHMYSKGGHGFGMRKQNLPSDQWIDRFGEWLQLHGLLTK